MSLTPAQYVTLKAAIASETDSTFVFNRTAGNVGPMADFFNTDSTFVVWKTSLAETEVVSTTITDPTFSAGLAQTTFSWSQLIARSVQEQYGWDAMFKTGYANPSLANVRQGFADIFSGATTAPTNQRAYLLAFCKRFASKVEKLFATGTGTVAAVGFLVFEGQINGSDIDIALRS